MTSLANLSLKEIEDIIVSQKKIWCVGCYNRIFTSDIKKMFCNPSSRIFLSVWDKELASDKAEYRDNNAGQQINIYNCFTTQTEAIEQQNRNLKEVSHD